jgi:uncharacterized SAM-binding protein YcdF (DUF218 family)
MSSKKTQVDHKRILSYAGIMLAFFIFALLLFPRAASFLVKTSPAVKADAAFILMGSVADRLLQAADLYEAGLVEQLILVNEKQTGMEFLKKRGVQIPSLAALSKQALIDLGIPDSLITILAGQASSTRAEADSLASYLSHNPQIKA